MYFKINQDRRCLDAKFAVSGCKHSTNFYQSQVIQGSIDSGKTIPDASVTDDGLIIIIIVNSILLGIYNDNSLPST